MSTPPAPGDLVYMLAALAAVLAIMLARRRAEHRLVALFLAAMVAIDITRLYLRNAFDLGTSGLPYDAARRAAFHVDELGFLAWPAGLAALALVVFVGRKAWPILVVWAVVGMALIALFPSDLVRRHDLQRVYLAAYLGSMAVYGVAFARWISNWRVKLTTPGPEHTVLFLLGAVELARAVPFYGSVFDRWATYGPPTNAILYAVISAVQGVYLWMPSRSP